MNVPMSKVDQILDKLPMASRKGIVPPFLALKETVYQYVDIFL